MSMTAKLHHHDGLTIMEVPAEGGPLGPIDIIGETYGRNIDWVALPASRLPDDFFRLRSGVLGEFTQKFVTYGLRLAVLGDVTSHVGASEAFRAYVAEANRGSHLRFVEDVPALLALLGRAGR